MKIFRLVVHVAVLDTFFHSRRILSTTTSCNEEKKKYIIKHKAIYIPSEHGIYFGEISLELRTMISSTRSRAKKLFLLTAKMNLNVHAELDERSEPKPHFGIIYSRRWCSDVDVSKIILLCVLFFALSLFVPIFIISDRYFPHIT